MFELIQQLKDWWRLRRCSLCGNSSSIETSVFSNNYGKYRLCADDRECGARIARRRLLKCLKGGK